MTGGSSGIGLAIATVLAEEGYSLTLCSRRQARLDEAVAALRDRGAMVAAFAANLADDDGPAAAVVDHQARYGRLDVLVHSAGIGFHDTIANHRSTALGLEVQLNYRSPFQLLRAALPLLIAAGAEHQKATVVNVASYSGVHPMAGLASYSATKAALVALSRAAQAELGQFGIQVTALCPGYVDTPMSDYWSEQVPKAEMLRPSDVAEAVRFLLHTSPACRVPEIVLARGDGGL